MNSDKLNSSSESRIWGYKSKIYNLVRGIPIISNILERENRGISTLTENFTKTEPILDLGSGTGNSSTLLPHFDIVSTDYSFSMCKTLNREDTICCNALNLPFLDSSFNNILAIGVSEYIEDLTPLVLEIKRVLKSNGSVVFTSSPKSLFTQLRKLSGNRIYPRDSRYITNLFKNEGFSLVRSNEIVMTQDQYLFKLTKQS